MTLRLSSTDRAVGLRQGVQVTKGLLVPPMAGECSLGPALPTDFKGENIHEELMHALVTAN